VEKDEKKRVKVLQMLEAMTTDPEVYLMTAYGEKGVHYDLNGEAVVKKPDYTDGQKTGAKTGIGLWFNHYSGGSPLMRKYDRPQDQLAYRAKLTDGVKLQLDAIAPAVLPSQAQYGAALNQLISEYMIKFIYGEVDLDKGFDDFVDKWKKAGGKQLTDEANKIYNERLSAMKK